MSFSTILPPSYSFGQKGIQLASLGVKKEEKATSVENYLLDQVASLPTHQKAQVHAFIKTMVGKIKEELKKRQDNGISGAQIELESEELFSRLQVTVVRFLKKTEENSHKNYHEACKARDFAQRLEAINLDFADFIPSSLPKNPGLMALMKKSSLEEKYQKTLLPKVDQAICHGPPPQECNAVKKLNEGVRACVDQYLEHDHPAKDISNEIKRVKNQSGKKANPSQLHGASLIHNALQVAACISALAEKTNELDAACQATEYAKACLPIEERIEQDLQSFNN